MPDSPPELTLLQRREIEARIVAPLVRAFMEEVGVEKTLGILQRVISNLARASGEGLAQSIGDPSLTAFVSVLNLWKAGGALEMEIITEAPDRLEFNVTRCRFAEMYRSLGMEDLGESLSCCRDSALIEGFNPEVTLSRTQTIMQGATHCDFRFRTRDATETP